MRERSGMGWREGPGSLGLSGIVSGIVAPSRQNAPDGAHQRTSASGPWTTAFLTTRTDLLEAQGQTPFLKATTVF